MRKDLLDYVDQVGPGAFDAIVASFDLVRRMAKILRPKGRLVFVDLMYQDAARRAQLIDKYKVACPEAVEGIQEEFYWDPSTTRPLLSSIGYAANLKRFSDYTRGLMATPGASLDQAGVTRICRPAMNPLPLYDVASRGEGMAEVLRIDADVVTCKEPLVARYLTMMADCRALTMESIKDLRFDLIYWRRNDFDSNIGDLLYHIAYIEADWLFTDVLESRMPPELTQQLLYRDRDNHGRLVHIGEEQLESSLLRLNKVRARLNETYAGMDLAEFRRLRHSEQHDVSPEWVLHHLLQHEAEHRGQINLLKRLGSEARGKTS